MPDGHDDHHNHHADTVFSSADGDVITEGDGNYRVLASGSGDQITLGNGNQFVAVSGTSDVIAIGDTPGMSSIVSTGGIAEINAGDGNVTVLAGGDDNTVMLGDGHDTVLASGMLNHIEVGSASGSNDRNLVTTGGNSTVIMGAGRNTVFASGDVNTITTGDGVQRITAVGEFNQVSIGNTPAGGGADDAGCMGDGDHGARSAIQTGDFARINAGDGNVSVTATGGHDMVQAGAGDDSIFLLDGTNAGFNTVVLGNGSNQLLLTGEHNTVIGGGGTDMITAGTGNDVFMLNAAGSATTIDNFQSTDHVVLSALLGGNTDGITLTTTADPRFGSGAVDTLITATGATATAHVTLTNFDGGSVMAMLSAGMLAA